jgi:hypothetical protein
MTSVSVGTSSSRMAETERTWLVLQISGSGLRVTVAQGGWVQRVTTRSGRECLIWVEEGSRREEDCLQIAWSMVWMCRLTCRVG